MHMAVHRGRIFFPLGEALQLDYNPVAKCPHRGRVTQTVSNLRQFANDNRELLPVLVRNDTYVQSTGRLFRRNFVEHT